MKGTAPEIIVHDHDLPDGLDLGASIAIDTETMGLNHLRDRLCLVQLSSGDNSAHLVRIRKNKQPAPNLARMLADPAVEKIFHFARFDLAALMHGIGPVHGPIFCTKIASKLIRTYTDRHGLSELVREILGVEISKQQQSSDWGAGSLTPEQEIYAANDVLFLHQIKASLLGRLERENRLQEAAACFAFLPTRAALDLGGFETIDIFSH